MTYDTLVFVGRFRPWTRAHREVAERALSLSNELILLVGSADGPRSYRNSFSFDEVVQMIVGSLTPEQADRVTILPLPDASYDDAAWVESVQSLVDANTDRGAKIGLIGHSKDASSYYLKLFPLWGSVDVENIEGINATTVRQAFFQHSDWVCKVGHLLPDSSIDVLCEFEQTDAFKDLEREYKLVAEYPDQWGTGPFVTVDAVCVQAGHVLLIERADFPGVGLLALPGGFLEPEESLLDGALRELGEETEIDVPKGIIKANLKGTYTFDDPHRDPRARLITVAHLFDLSFEVSRRATKRKAGAGPLELTRVKGASDAKRALWVPLAELDPAKMFADHYHIIRKMLALYA